MEARPKIKSSVDDAFNDILGDNKPVTQSPKKASQPVKKSGSILDDAFNDIVKKKEGTQDSGTGSQPSDTTVLESQSTTLEPKPSTEKLPERQTPFNSLTLSPDQFQQQLDAPLNARQLQEPEKKKVSSAEFLYKDINTHAPNVFEDVAKTADKIVPRLSQFDKDEISKQTTKDVFYSPERMAEYTKERVNALRSEITALETKKLKSSQVPVTVGTGVVTMPTNADKEAFEKANKNIAEKQAYIDQLKNSVAELASERIVSQSDLSTVNFKDLGRKIIKIADPELDNQFKLAEKGGNLPGIRGTQLESLGLNAVKQYLKKYPNTPNADQAKRYVQDRESDFDERNIEATAARVRTKMGKYFYDEGKSGVFGYSEQSLNEAVNSPKTGLTPSEKRIAENYVIPTEKRIWGTDIPGSGFARSFRNAIEKTAEGTVKSVKDITGMRDESDIAGDVLNQPANTRYAPIASRGFWQETRDGIGDLTGQVAMMALATKGVGTIGKALTASGAEGGLLGGMTRTVVGQTLANENVGLFLNSFLNSYDNHYQEAVATMSGKDQGTARKAYATTMATVEGLSEKIFNDTKILKAFSKEAAPAIKDITNRFLSNEITSQIAREEMQGALKKTLTPFVKEYGKYTVQEASEEAVVDIAQGVAQSVFGGTPFDIAKTGQQAVNTFLTTALYSPLVAGMAARGAVRQNNSQSAFMKSAIGQMAANPGEYLQTVDNLAENGEITADQANEKRKLIRSASNVLQEIPETRQLELSDKDGGNPRTVDIAFTPEETTSYIVHRLNEQIIENKLKNTTDPVLTSALNKELKRSVEIRKGIYDGSIKVNEDLQEVAPDVEVAEELNIGNPEVISQPIELSVEPVGIVGVDEISQPIELNPDGQTEMVVSEGKIDTLQPIEIPEAPEVPIENIEPQSVELPALITNETKEFVTKSGNQKVIRDDNGKLSVVNVSDGKPATDKMRRKATKEYAINYDYSQGEKAAEPEEGTVYSDEKELKRDMVEKSSHPAELAAIFLDEDEVLPPLNSVEQVILDNGQFTVTDASYKQFGDRNNLNNSKARSYIRKDGDPIDVVAANLSNESGIEITPQDIIEFMDRFPNGIEDAEKKSQSEVAQDAAAKFEQLTGLSLTPEIAEIAVNQEFEKIQDINNVLLNDSYETGRNITDAYAESLKKPAVAPVKSQSENVTPTREVGKEDNADKPTKPTIREAGKDLANKLRALKSSRAQANANIFGLAVAVYDGVIETIATAIENGAALAEAIQTGLNSLSQEDRSRVDENAFKQHVEDFMADESATEPDNGNTTGIKHASTEDLRQEFGLGDEYQKTEIKDAEIEAEADAAIKEGYNIERLLLKIQNGTQPSPLETVILGKYQAGLVSEIEKIPTAENLSRLNDFRKTVDAIGSIQGRAFRLRQRLDVREDTLAGFFMQDLDFNGGNPLTEEQQKRTEAEYKKISEAKEKLEKELKKSEDENKKLKAEKGERTIREVAKNAKQKKSDADFAKDREKIINDIKAAWNKSKGNLTATIVPYAPQLVAIAPFIGKLTASYVNQGITKLSDLVDSMHTDLVQTIPQITKDDVLDLLVGEYKTKPPAPPPLTPQAIALKDIYIELKKERAVRLLQQKYANRNTRQKVGDLILEIINIPRSLMSSTDFSAPLRQAVIPTVSHPGLAAKAGLEMFKQSVSQKRFDRWFYDLKDSPRYKLMQMSGLYVADPHDIRLGIKEESFMNNLAEKIPIFGRVVKGSERAYVGYLNKMRVDLFNRAVDALENDGITFDSNEQIYKGLASMVNNTTGRGNVGKLESAAPVLNSIFFAPRYTASILNILGLSDVVTGGNGYYGNLPPKIRKMALLDLSKFIGAGISVMALLWAAYKDDDDFSIELDPRSSDFAKIKFGTTRWNIWGSYQPTIRYLTQIIAGQSKSNKSGKIVELDGAGPFGRTRADVAAAYLRSKMAPIPSTLWDVASGRNAVGEKVTWQMEIQNHTTPLFLQDLTDAVEDKGVKSLFTVGLPSMFGISVQTQSPKNFKDVDKKDPVFKFLFDKNVNLQEQVPQGTMTDKEYKSFNEEKSRIFKDEWEQVIKNGALLNEEGKPTVNTNSGVSIKESSKLSDEELSTLMKEISGRSTKQAKKNLGIETKKQ